MASQFKVTPEKSFARWLIAFALIWMALHTWNHHNLKSLFVCTIGAVAIAIAVRRPAWLFPVNFLWSGLGYALSLVMVPLVSTFLYYVVVTPTALVMRKLGYDPLRTIKEPEATTYWLPYKHSKSMKSPF